MDDRREHAGGTPRADRAGDQWVPLVEFPYEVLDGFAHEEKPHYPVEMLADALREIAVWILNGGRFQERGVTDRAMVFAFMIAPEATGCSTQAELAVKMKLSRSQVNEHVKQFGKRFGFVSRCTYSERQRENQRKRRKTRALWSRVLPAGKSRG
jgi:hypothetical protein